MEELEEVFDMKTDLLDYVLENGFHMAGYLKQKHCFPLMIRLRRRVKAKGEVLLPKKGREAVSRLIKRNVRVSGNAMLRLLKYPRMCCIRNFTTAW